MENMDISKDIKFNIDNMKQRLKDCDDIKSRTMMLGGKSKVEACIFYVEVAVNNLTIEESVIGKLLNRLWEMPPSEQYDYLRDNALGVSDVKELKTIDEAIQGIMIGDAVLFVDGYDKAIKISSKGYPAMSVGESKNEKVIRGSREGFADSVKTNTALIRKRIRNSELKVKEKIMGNKSNTTVAIVYIEGVARKSVLEEINRRLNNMSVDGLSDSGIIEQLTEEKVHSPFPQYQTTERPDKAAMELLNGRIILLVDNSPVALMLPTNYNSFFQTADDYYNRYAIVSFARIIRYLATFIAISLPAFYLAVVNYNPELLPTELLLSFTQARQSVPFPAFIEVLLMELSFELLREAGIRIPGPIGSTIGIVGGLIIGQAAVTANLVSPIIVIVVAVTALASFAIPNEELSSAFRLLKYFQIIMSGIFGVFGIIVSWIIIISHLSRMESFKFPYLMPVAAMEINDYEDAKDSVLRFPLYKLRKKSIYAKPGSRKEKI